MIGYTRLKALLKRNFKAIAICSVVVLAVLVGCLYRQAIDAVHSVRRRAEVRKIMDDDARNSPHYIKRNFHIRGPLTIARVKEELFGGQRTTDRAPESSVGNDFDQAWANFKRSYMPGDELYFFSSDRGSWKRLSGLEGYVAIRGNAVVGFLVTEEN